MCSGKAFLYKGRALIVLEEYEEAMWALDKTAAREHGHRAGLEAMQHTVAAFSATFPRPAGWVGAP